MQVGEGHDETVSKGGGDLLRSGGAFLRAKEKNEDDEGVEDNGRLGTSRDESKVRLVKEVLLVGKKQRDAHEDKEVAVGKKAVVGGRRKPAEAVVAAGRYRTGPDMM